MTSYKVTAQRAGKYWHLSIDGLTQGTQAKSLTEAPEMAADLISILTGEDPSTLDISLAIHMPERIRILQDDASRYRAEAERTRALAQRKTREAAQLMRSEGMAVKDIGRVLGVSHQRASQILS